jgi:hypothetical protein
MFVLKIQPCNSNYRTILVQCCIRDPAMNSNYGTILVECCCIGDPTMELKSCNNFHSTLHHVMLDWRSNPTMDFLVELFHQTLITLNECSRYILLLPYGGTSIFHYLWLKTHNNNTHDSTHSGDLHINHHLLVYECLYLIQSYFALGIASFASWWVNIYKSLEPLIFQNASIPEALPLNRNLPYTHRPSPSIMENKPFVCQIIQDWTREKETKFQREGVT